MTVAVNDDLLGRRGLLDSNGCAIDVMDAAAAEAGAEYMDPSTFSSQVCVKVSGYN